MAEVTVTVKDEKADARAAFDATMSRGRAKGGDPKSEVATAVVEKAKDTRVPPEQIWKARPAKVEKAEAEEPEKPARERDEAGKFKAKAEEADEPETNKVTEYDEEQMEEWKSALRRSGFRAKELSAMSDEEIAKRGSRRLKALQADDEAHLIAKQARAPQREPEKTEKREPARKTDEAQALDFKALTKPIAAKLGLDDDEGSSTLAEFAKTLAEASTKPLREELETLRKQVTGSSEVQMATYLTKAQKELVGTFPPLAEPETIREVVEQMDAMAGSPKYQRISDVQLRYTTAMKDAAIILGIETDADAAAERQTAESDKTKRKYGRSTVSERTKPVAATPLEADRERFDAIMERRRNS